MPPKALFESQGSMEHDNLFAGDFPRSSGEGLLLTTQGVLVRGSVLGIVTATGKLKLVASAAGDGSQTGAYILAEATDTTGGDIYAPIYKTGEFNINEVVVGVGHTVASVRQALEDRSIFLRDTVSV